MDPSKEAGGGTSTGGIYSLSGTLWQPDAGGSMRGGNYKLVGGFSRLPFAVQFADAPLLSIVPFGTTRARISSTGDASGSQLQETTSLSTGPWGNSPTGSSNPVIVPATVPIKSYRLRKP
jgi:hypothetical protein